VLDIFRRQGFASAAAIGRFETGAPKIAIG
jgi:hypothetical protein